MAKQLTGQFKMEPRLIGNFGRPRKLTGMFEVTKEYSTYHGSYLVVPRANRKQVLRTQNRIMKEDVTVLEVPYFETSNETGTTVYIAKEV